MHTFNIYKKPAKHGLEFGTLADAQSYSITFRAYLYKHG